ncbi:MAG: hypothetical protein OXI60_00135 [Acidiferrobacterales bacterium]|nr:hypothetical protein [Acidiferrobacterales bacterium]
MSKYMPLELYLKSVELETISMTFAEIESIINCSLPPSARKHRPWWSNNTFNSAMTRSWIAAGFKATQVDIDREAVVFVKAEVKNKAPNTIAIRVSEKSKVHPAFGCLRGTVTIPSDTDLTEPAMEDWTDLAMNARIHNE